VLGAGNALGTGFRLADHDAFATGRGEAFAATADNASAIYYNPAGITQLDGPQLRGGIYGLYLDRSYRSPGGAEWDNDNDLHAVPQVYYAWASPTYPLAFGLGIYSPFGLSGEWPDTVPFRTAGVYGRLNYTSISPIIAWRVTPTLSIAAGPTANYADTHLRSGLLPFPGAGDGLGIEGNGWAAGFKAGILWKVHEKVQLGAAYRHHTTVDLKGHTEITGLGPGSRHSAQAEFDFPHTAVVGISFRPTPAWNLEVNVDWTGWERVNTVLVRQNPAPPAPIPAVIPLAFEWDSSFTYEFGVTRYFEGGWHLSAGYVFNENSVPDQNYNPIVADLDRHFLSAGAGFRMGKLDVDVAYQYGFAEDRTVTGAVGASAPVNGTHRFGSHALFVSLGWRF